MSQVVPHVKGRDVLMRFLVNLPQGYFWLLVVAPECVAGTRGVVREPLTGN